MRRDPPRRVWRQSGTHGETTMALIECPDCGTDVSSKAPTCPRCAYPVSKKLTGSSSGLRSSYGGLEVAKQLLGRVVLGGVLFASGVSWEAPPVIISALVILGSCVPIWLRARKAAILGHAGDSAMFEGRVKELMADMEYRQMQQLDEVAEQSSRQIAELEERLDFTERLLAKQADQLQGPN